MIAGQACLQAGVLQSALLLLSCECVQAVVACLACSLLLHRTEPLSPETGLHGSCV